MAARVVLTRPVLRQVALQQALEAAGIEVLGLPALTVVSLSDIKPLPQPKQFDAVVFVSRTAWQLYWQALHTENPRFKWPLACQLAGVGAVTAQAISQDLSTSTPEATVLRPADDAPQDSETLWLSLKEALAPKASVLLVRGEEGRDWLAQTLQSHGFVVQTHENYRREPAQWSPKAVATLKEWQSAGMLGTWLITSAHGLGAIQAQWQAQGFGAIRPKSAVVIHPRLVALVSAWLAPDATVRVTSPDDQSVLNALTERR